MVTSRFIGWIPWTDKRWRAVGTRQTGMIPVSYVVPLGVLLPSPAVETAGYRCPAPMGSCDTACYQHFEEDVFQKFGYNSIFLWVIAKKII